MEYKKPKCFNYANYVKALERIKALEDENAMLSNSYKLIAAADEPVKPEYEDGVPVCRNCGTSLMWDDGCGIRHRADFCFCCGQKVDWKDENDISGEN